MWSVREINDFEQLHPIRADWNRLLLATPGANFFQSFDWLEVYWRYFGAGQKLRALLVLDGEDLAGVLPLVVRRESTRVGMVRVLTYPLDDWGDSYGPIGPEPALVLAAGMAHVRRTRRDWDLIEPRWIVASDLLSATESAFAAAGLSHGRSVWCQPAVVDLGGTYDAYLASRTRKWRNNLRRFERRLSEQGELRHVRYRPAGAEGGDADPRWDLYDACQRIARNSWQGSSTTGTTLSHEKVAPFLRDVHAVAAACGAVDLNLLMIGDRPAAFLYNYYFGGRLFGLRTGFDPELGQFGPGNHLYHCVIRDSFARGDAFFDLGPDYLDAKRQFITGLMPVYRVSHFALASPRAQLLRCKRWLQAERIAAPVAGGSIGEPASSDALD